MAMQAEPLTRLTEEIGTVRRQVARLIRADGQLSPEEEEIEALLTALHTQAAAFEQWRAVGDAYRRCGPNAYTQRLAREAGWQVIDGQGPRAA